VIQQWADGREGPCPSWLADALEGVILGEVFKSNLSTGESKSPCSFGSPCPKHSSSPLSKWVTTSRINVCARKRLWLGFRFVTQVSLVGCVDHDAEGTQGQLHLGTSALPLGRGERQPCVSLRGELYPGQRLIWLGMQDHSGSPAWPCQHSLLILECFLHSQSLRDTWWEHRGLGNSHARFYTGRATLVQGDIHQGDLGLSWWPWGRLRAILHWVKSWSYLSYINTFAFYNF
jgi:hypothetical protein